MIIALIAFGLVIGIIILFASPTLSPIPYFPSNAKDIPLIINTLNLKNRDIVFDLGAGDGAVIYAAARDAYKKNLDTRFVAVEMNPVLSLILHIRRLIHPNRRNITIVNGDMFRTDYKSFISEKSNVKVFLYVSPRFIPRIINHLQITIPRFTLISYFYPIDKNLPEVAKGQNSVYRQEIIDKVV